MLEMYKFKSEEEVMNYMTSEEMKKKVQNCVDYINKICTEDLNEEEIKIYYEIQKGIIKPENIKKYLDENPKLYGATMQSISMGLG